ncbi:MAG: DUF4272 domain-containing protein [Phycisphaerales bacterium]|nr:DUF4272 domain-containing protein [Phycisphaerales bacterium]
MIKRENESIIRNHGGEICDWLPSYDPDIPPRDSLAVARRALVLNATLQLVFNAPIPIIRRWISANRLDGDLVESEKLILARSNDALTEQERTDLYWQIEALWALVWTGGFINELPFNLPVGSNLASLFPKLQHNEDGSNFLLRFHLRPHLQLFRMLDLYYRLHWWTRSAHLRGQRTGEVIIDMVMERRKALAWVLCPEGDWDSVDLST